MKQILRSSIFFIGVYLIASGGCIVNKKTALELYQMGLKSDSSFLYKTSIKFYSAAIKKDPGRPEYYVKRAEATYKMNIDKGGRIADKIDSDYNEAVRVADAIKATDSVFYDIYKSRLIYHFEYKHYAYVVESSSKIISEYPSRYEPYLYKGLSLFQLGNFSNAEHVLDSALLLAPNKSEVLLPLAKMEYYKGQFANSIFHFKQADSLQSLGSTENSIVARAYWQMNKKDSACIYFNKNSHFSPSGMDKEISTYCQPR